MTFSVAARDPQTGELGIAVSNRLITALRQQMQD